MGFYEEQPPRHGHRTPSELAEDEALSALRGDFCGMPEAPERPCRTGAACVPKLHVALLSWADAHPLTATPGSRFFAASDTKLRNPSHDNQHS